MKIGIFDSGIGGLAVAKSINNKFPQIDLYYVADKKYAPFGELSESEILERSRWCARKLLDKKIDLLVIACNTATAAAVAKLREELSIPIIGVEPDLHFKARENLSHVESDKICVICTNYTYNSQKFKDLQKRRDPNLELNYRPMKNLARLIEQCFWSEEKNEDAIIDDLLGQVDPKKFQYLVLGCTHYELIKNLIEQKTGLKTIGIADAITKRVNELFGHELKNFSERNADSWGKFFYLDSLNSQWQNLNLQEFLRWPGL